MTVCTDVWIDRGWCRVLMSTQLRPGLTLTAVPCASAWIASRKAESPVARGVVCESVSCYGHVSTPHRPSLFNFAGS